MLIKRQVLERINVYLGALIKKNPIHILADIEFTIKLVRLDIIDIILANDISFNYCTFLGNVERFIKNYCSRSLQGGKIWN